jgi:hypothetical protein
MAHSNSRATRDSRQDNNHQNGFDLNSETILILPNKTEKNIHQDQKLQSLNPNLINNNNNNYSNSKAQIKKSQSKNDLIQPYNHQYANKMYQEQQQRQQLQQQQQQLLQKSDNINNFSEFSLSSESFITERVENTQTLYELVSFIRTYLKKLENSYSLDDLYSFLKTNVKFNGYRNFTIELLERYAKPKYTSCLGCYNDTNLLPEPQLHVANNPANQIRSVSQLKPSPNPTSMHNLNGKKSQKATKPVQKLLKYLNLFKTLFHIVQRDLVVNIFLLDISSHQVTNEQMSTANKNVKPFDSVTNEIARMNSSQMLNSARPSSRSTIVHGNYYNQF